MATALNARDLREAALAENARQRRENAITSGLLNDLDGLEMAIDGCVFFLSRSEGHRLEGLDDVRLSPQAQRFLESA